MLQDEQEDAGTLADRALRTLRRHVLADGLAGRMDRLLGRIEYRIARTDHELEAIRRHWHDVYVRVGHCDPLPDGRLADPLDEASSTLCCAVTIDDRLVGAVRVGLVSADGERGLSGSMFPDVVEPLLGDGGIVAEPGRLTVDPAAAKERPLLHMAVLRVPIMAAVHYGAEHCLAMVHPRHAAFYRRMMNATQLCEPRRVPGLVTKVGLLDVHVPSAVARGRARRGFWLARPGEAEALFPPLAELLPERAAA